MVPLGVCNRIDPKWQVLPWKIFFLLPCALFRDHIIQKFLLQSVLVFQAPFSVQDFPLIQGSPGFPGTSRSSKVLRRFPVRIFPCPKMLNTSGFLRPGTLVKVPSDQRDPNCNGFFCVWVGKPCNPTPPVLMRDVMKIMQAWQGGFAPRGPPCKNTACQ